MHNAAWYSQLAKSAARFCGRPRVFVLAVCVIAAWVITGPIFGFSDTWQLVINTGTTIVTFLMVFLIQNTQYRDTEAIQVKLDELIRATKGAHNALLDLEELEEKDLDAFRAKYQALARAARAELGRAFKTSEHRRREPCVAPDRALNRTHLGDASRDPSARRPALSSSVRSRSHPVNMLGIPFGTTDWSEIAPTEYKGERGRAYWRTQHFGAIRVRMVEYSPGYLADHWCVKGHILLCMEGELHTELEDGRRFTLKPGMSYQVADNAEPHRSYTECGARLFIVD